MKRTAGRPTAKGELGDRQTLLFATTLCGLGSALLYLVVNPLTMWLTFATFIGYAVVYTVILKPLTVSYTHLDVYKRQASTMPIRAQNTIS